MKEKPKPVKVKVVAEWNPETLKWKIVDAEPDEKLLRYEMHVNDLKNMVE